jgi:Hus1-like protein
MRLRAKVINVDLFQSMSSFCTSLLFVFIRPAEIVLAAEKIHKECVLYLNPKKIQLIVVPDVTDGMQVWSGASVVCSARVVCGGCVV